MTDGNLRLLLLSLKNHYPYKESYHTTASKKKLRFYQRDIHSFHLSHIIRDQYMQKSLRFGCFFVVPIHCVCLNGFANSQANQNCISDPFNPPI